MTILQDVLPFLDELAPLSLAADWDNVGLLLGSPLATVSRVLTCLTLTLDVVGEAIQEKADLIVTHHPILFRPAKRLTMTSSEGGVVLRLAKAGIAVYSPHTAYDNARGGINDLLAEAIGISKPEPLRPKGSAHQVKLVVFVPAGDLTRVMDALFEAGAGRIGNYRECSFRGNGTGTFFGEDAANPTVGTKGRREDVQESRLEVLCPKAKLGLIVAALRQAHSYEEPAFDIYPLEPDPSRIGEGRIGMVDRPVTAPVIARRLKSRLGKVPMQLVALPQTVVRAAVACGSAAEFLSDAQRGGADLFVTGEARFHDCLAAREMGIGMLLIGHYASERFGMEVLAERIRERFPKLEAWASRSEADPATWI